MLRYPLRGVEIVTDADLKTAEQIKETLAATIYAHWKALLVQGVIMIVLGMLAISLPHIATMTTELLIGWLLLFGGALRIVSVFRARKAPGAMWSMLIAVLVSILGLVLVAQPLQGALTLTIVLIGLFIFEGFAALFISLDFKRHVGNWGWVAFSGVVSLVLAFMIWRGLPATASWAIGLLVGINMVMGGVSIAMMALAAHKTRPNKR